MSSRLRILLVIAVAAVLAGWLGYRQAYIYSSNKDSVSEAPRTKDRHPRPVEKASDPAADLSRLRKGPVNAKTSGEAWTIISRFSIRQIKDALADMPQGKPTDAVSDQESMLYFCWAQIDPLEALEAAGEEIKKNKEKTMILDSAFTAWMKTDPDAAYQWAMKSPTIDNKVAFRQMARLLDSLPPEEALEKAKAYAPEVMKILMTRLGGNMAETAEGREKFLTLLARSGFNPQESARSLSSLARSWAEADPVAALAALKDLPMDDKAREESRRILTLYWTERDPAAVIAWMTGGENPQPLAAQTRIYQKWAEQDPEQAALEFENLSRQSPGFRDEVMKSLLTSYHQGGWIPFGRTKDSEARLFSRLKIHYDQWATHDPEHASAWVGSLDPTLQQKLKSSDLHEKN